MRTVLASAYDINPYRGSESGTGWNLVLQIARNNRVVAVTRKNNRYEIERYIDEEGVDVGNIEFNYFDLPRWAMFWKKGARFSKLYFYLWQMFLPWHVAREKIKFDIAHNVNFHTDSTPTFLWLLRKPTVWGPINHNEPIPAQYLTGKIEYLKDRLKWAFKCLSWWFDPFLRLAVLKSNAILGGNRSVSSRLMVPSSKFHTLSTIAGADHEFKREMRQLNKFRVVVIGRQIPVKSMDIAISSYNHFYQGLNSLEREKVELVLLGDGQLHESLVSQAFSHESAPSVVVKKWVEHSQMGLFYQDATCLLNCSHEGAGAIIAEAFSYGVPMVCFENFGAGESADDSCAIKVKYLGMAGTVEAFSAALSKLYFDRSLLEELSFGAEKYFSKNLRWDCKGDQFDKLYNDLRIK